LHARVRSVSHEVVDEIRNQISGDVGEKSSEAISGGWAETVVVHWLSWSVCAEISDIIWSGSGIGFVVNTFIAIAVASDLVDSVESVPETNVVSDFVGSGLLSESDVVGVHPKSSEFGFAFWIPRESSDSKESSASSLSLLGNEDVEVDERLFCGELFNFKDVIVPLRIVSIRRNLSKTLVCNKVDFSCFKSESSSCEIDVDLTSLVSDS